jgi:hypothetical protein
VQWNSFLFLEDETFVVACIHYAVLIRAAMSVILELEEYIVCRLLVLCCCFFKYYSYCNVNFTPDFA